MEVNNSLTAEGKDVNEKDRKELTALHLAVVKGELEEIKTIIEHGADINFQDCDGNTPLHIALKGSNSQTIEKCSLLLERGADVQLKNKDGQTPLSSVLWRSPQIVPILLRSVSGKKAVNIPGINNDYPIHVATRMWDATLIKLLLDNGADVNCKDLSGQTPVHMALHEPELAVLLDAGALVNVRDEYGNTPLQEALQFKYKTVHMLLKCGADFNYENIHGETLLYVAVKHNNFEGVKLLLKYGADVNSKVINGQSLLNTAAKYKDFKVVELLLKYGADVNNCKDLYEPVLHTALKFNNYKGMEIFLKYGANFNCKDQDGQTPLHLAVLYNNYEGVDILLKCGADVNCQNDMGMTPLMYTKCYSITELLLQMGAKVNIQDNCGKTVLYYVENTESMISEWVSLKSTLADMLLDWGASPIIPDGSGLHISKAVIKYNVRREFVNLPKVFKDFSREVSFLDYSWLGGVSLLEMYRASCKEEADRLKQEHLDNHSLYCIFGQYGEPRYFKNKELEKDVNQKDLADNFPIYNYLLKSTFKKAKDREGLVEAVLNTILTPLPEEVMRHILSFVDDDSLQRVMEAKNVVDT